jgi:hypothetical protein
MRRRDPCMVNEDIKIVPWNQFSGEYDKDCFNSIKEQLSRRKPSSDRVTNKLEIFRDDTRFFVGRDNSYIVSIGDHFDRKWESEAK